MVTMLASMSSLYFPLPFFPSEGEEMVLLFTEALSSIAELSGFMICFLLTWSSMGLASFDPVWFGFSQSAGNVTRGCSGWFSDIFR